MALRSPTAFKMQVQSVDPYEFEQFVADIWEARGWSTIVTSGGSDRGVDIVARKNEAFKQKHVLQVKRYGPDNVVGGPEIQQYASLKRQKGADAVIVVTSSHFSSQAEELADDLNVKLVDGNDLYGIIQSESLDDVVSEYMTTGREEQPAPSGSPTTAEGGTSSADGGSTTSRDWYTRDNSATSSAVESTDTNSTDSTRDTKGFSTTGESEPQRTDGILFLGGLLSFLIGTTAALSGDVIYGIGSIYLSIIIFVLNEYSYKKDWSN